MSVTFRSDQPEAETVAIAINGQTWPMAKGADGIWEVTTDPVTPGLKIYQIVVDGVSMPDVNGNFCIGTVKKNSYVEVPEPDGEFYQVKDVPHGEVRGERYWSEGQQEWRQCIIYLPAEYEACPDKRYPVVYIQHGGGEDEYGWPELGKMGTILDNLIAEGKVAPMVLVSPNSILKGDGGPRGYNMEGMRPYMAELKESIIPHIDESFRTLADREHRAMCGLSMGGGQSFFIGLNSPETFAHVGIFSTGVFGGIATASNVDFEGDIPGIFSDTESFNNAFKTVFITCGEQDPRIEPTKKAVAELKSHGVDLEFASYPGDHEWRVWRKSLRDFAQMIFK